MFSKVTRFVLAVAIVFTLPSNAHAAMPCDRVGAKSQLHYGSQVSGSSVRICGEYWLKFAPKPAPKPVGPPKVYPKSFVAMPSAPAVVHAGPAVLSLGESVNFRHTAVTHSREGLLMGFRTEVRFRPVKVLWLFGGSSVQAGQTISRAFATPGLHNVRVRVTYAVKFRFLGGTNWLKEPRTITLTSRPIVVRVVEKTLAPSGRVILVRRDCSLNHNAIGC